jgi:hypothetical protein
VENQPIKFKDLEMEVSDTLPEKRENPGLVMEILPLENDGTTTTKAVFTPAPVSENGVNGMHTELRISPPKTNGLIKLEPITTLFYTETNKIIKSQYLVRESIWV